MMFTKGLNYNVSACHLREFSFYKMMIAERVTYRQADELYKDLKTEFLLHGHGDRGMSNMKLHFVSNRTENDYATFYVIACVKGEDELIFKIKYNEAKLLYGLSGTYSFDMYFEKDVDNQL